MRLVDADELPWIDKLIVLEKWDGDIRAEIKDNASYVDENTPTVEAIPVEWLKAQIEKCQKAHDVNAVAILAATIKQWRAENEID